MELVVVMPAVQRSFYADMNKGDKYWTFISEELPSLVEAWFPVSSGREDRFVAGLSMGGYGAFKLALRKPECFGTAYPVCSICVTKHSKSPTR
jgi:S-formylglutathione hydrolase FrmB